MSNPDSPTAILDHSAVISGHRAMQVAYFWILSAMAAAAGIVGLVYLESNRNEREAGRMIVASQGNAAYAAILVNGLAQRHGRPTP